MVVNWGQPMDLRQDFGSVYQMFIFGNISEQKTGEGSVVCVSMDLKLEAERHNSGTGKSSHTHTHTHTQISCGCVCVGWWGRERKLFRLGGHSSKNKTSNMNPPKIIPSTQHTQNKL